jgi:hypothetical protein
METLLPHASFAVAAALLVGVVACGGPAQEAASPAATATADDPPEKKVDDTATLDIYGNPPTKVLVDGKPAGTTPIQGFKVKPGSHDVTWADELTGNRTMSVTLEPGDGKVMTSDRPPSAMQHEKPEKGDKGKKDKDKKDKDKKGKDKGPRKTGQIQGPVRF